MKIRTTLLFAAALFTCGAAGAAEHYWSARAGDKFIYRATSPEPGERADDQVPVIYVSFEKLGDGWYEFSVVPRNYVMNCIEPCKTMNIGPIGSQPYRVVPIERGSLMWKMVEDARHGAITGR